ncbi:MAG: hypothetical protein LBT33_08780, partial [Spirochaetia bacterium]|nr:hypothetical protein [Spirochaetia bacterium]
IVRNSASFYLKNLLFSSNIVGSYGSPAKARVAAKKKRAASRLRALSELLFRRQALRVYNSACHKLKL